MVVKRPDNYLTQMRVPKAVIRCPYPGLVPRSYSGPVADIQSLAVPKP